MNSAHGQNRWLHAAGGFLLMGGWAMVANRSHAWLAVVSAGFVQGLLSACLTLVMKQLIEALVIRLAGWPGRTLPPLACFILSVSLLSVIHNVAGTPEILVTMSVPVTVATGYAAIYTQTLIGQREKSS